MDLQEIKKQIDIAGFPKETADALHNIIGMALARDGVLTDQETNDFFSLIDDAIIRMKKQTQQYMTLVQVVEDIQDGIIDSVEEAKEIEEEEKNNPAPAPIQTA